MGTLVRIYLLFLWLIPVGNRSAGRTETDSTELELFRKQMLEEINFLRTQPERYAEERLKQDQRNSTDNGAFEFLKKTKPVKRLKFNEKLNEIAVDYAHYMGRKNKFSHTANGTPFTRARKNGYTYTAMGENIACGNDPKLNAFENSKYAAIEFVRMLVIDKDVKDVGHRHTLVNPIYRSVGIGFDHNPKSYCINYVVQDFGNP